MNARQAADSAVKLSSADDCTVLGITTSIANLRWANNSVTTNGVSENMDLGIHSITDGRVGSIESSFFPDDSIPGLVQGAEKAAKSSPPAEDVMPLVGGDAAPDWEEDQGSTSIDVFGSFAGDLAKLFEKARKTDVALFGYAEHKVITLYLATSAGLRKRYVQSQGQVEMNAKSSDYSTSVWDGRITKDFTDVDAASIYRGLEQRLGWSKKKIALDPGAYEVLIEPSGVGDMLTYAYWTSTARNADEGRTVFSKAGGKNRIGESLFAKEIDIYSDPAEPGIEIEPFAAAGLLKKRLFSMSNSMASIFDDGAPLTKTHWAKGGELTNLIAPRYWAAKTGAEPAPYIHNLVLEGGDKSLDQMISDTERALMVTCFWYIREVDPQTLLLTGLTRDGVYLIEGGQVKGAVNNFRYNMSPVGMLRNTVEVGTSRPTLPREFGDYLTFTRMPPIRVEDFNMSSVSQAT